MAVWYRDCRRNVVQHDALVKTILWIFPIYLVCFEMEGSPRTPKVDVHLSQCFVYFRAGFLPVGECARNLLRYNPSVQPEHTLEHLLGHDFAIGGGYGFGEEGRLAICENVIEAPRPPIPYITQVEGEMVTSVCERTGGIEPQGYISGLLAPPILI